MDWNLFWNNLLAECQNIAIRLVSAVLILIIGKFLIKFIVKKLSGSKLMGKADAMVHQFVMAFVRISLYVILAASIVAILGVPMASIVAVIGSIGLAISLAVQGALGNLASGIMLLVFKPFRIGDFIESEEYSGTVSDMGVFYTTLLSTDNRTVVIPNKLLTESTIVNYSTQDNRRLDVQLDVAYGSDLELVKQKVLEVVARHGEVLNDPAPSVRLTEMRDSSLRVTLKLWCANSDYWALKYSLLEEILEEFGNAGIDIPFPQLDVHVKK